MPKCEIKKNICDNLIQVECSLTYVTLASSKVFENEELGKNWLTKSSVYFTLQNIVTWRNSEYLCEVSDDRINYLLDNSYKRISGLH